MQTSPTPGRSTPFTNREFHGIAIALAMAAIRGVLSTCGGGNSAPSAPGEPSFVSVTVSPSSVTVFRDATRMFTAKVTGTNNTAVSWSVEEGSGGTIDSAGVYTPPPNGSGTFHIVATSQANSIATGAAAAMVPLPQAMISPAAATLRPAGTRTFAASVTGLTNTAVNFTIQESVGG
jgi:hypothetical protein